ncbi:nucleoside hydrolase [Pleomorphomonas sp. PLEO]|uniref:nucleoside hydrolase n=1 Tax=Pleomorphomonas sp. PLEO TaxID=3239306 RepID=UPI00351F5860
MARKIIIDTDPGQDDAVAMLMALASPDELEVLGIVTVAGNVPLERTTYNARQVLELADRLDVPLHAGCDRPMRRPLVTAEHVHGPTGLDGPSLPVPHLPVQAKHGVAFLIDTLHAAAPGEITLVTLGPLTNLALALVQAPSIKAGIGELVMISGSFSEGGNITPSAGFNDYVAPEAVDVVLKSGLKITMVPMDVTHQCRSTPARLAAIEASGTASAKAAAAMLRFSEHFDLKKYGWDGAPLHDPCAVAYLLRPDLFAGRFVNVEVELTGTYTTGMTVVDWWRVTERPANATFLRQVDVDGFYDLLAARLARLP